MRSVFFILITIICMNLSAQTMAVMPIQLTGFKPERNQQFHSAFTKELLRMGYKVVDLANMDAVLRNIEFNLSDLVYDSNQSSQIGSILNVKYMLFSSFVWNGEYAMIDIHITDVETASIIYQNTYLTNSESNEIAIVGIPNIICDVFQIKREKANIFYDEKKYKESDEVIAIKTWARSRGISNVFLVYGLLSGYDKGTYEQYRSLDNNNMLPLYYTIENAVLDEKTQLENTGELVKVIHLGSYWKILDNITFYLKSQDILYDLVYQILLNKNNGVIFFGQRRETAIIESFLSKEQRANYLARWVWN